jgi:hypothetical protein
MVRVPIVNLASSLCFERPWLALNASTVDELRAAEKHSPATAVNVYTYRNG